MKSVKKMLFLLAVVLSCSVYGSYAQVYVRIRPERPHYERVVAPSPRHVWIDEEWENRGGHYVAVGGHWAAPPHPGWAWVPGHWAHERRGDYWIAGHWRR